MVRSVSEASNAKATAIVFAAHEFSSSTVRAYDKLADEARSYGDVFVFTDGVRTPPPHMQPRTSSFHFEALKEQFPCIVGSTSVPGNCHATCWDFHCQHPAYDYYWFIEYDVRFSGSWGRFFEQYRHNDADLLACHVRRFVEEPLWHWWGGLSMAGRPFPEADRLRAFLPIQRLSARALAAIGRTLERGWTGHFEALVPTALSLEGLRIEDMGGDGSFVREPNRNALYSSASTEDGSLRGGGTMRFRPTHAVWGVRPNKLYHPVKPRAWKTAAVLAELVEELRAFGFHARRKLRRVTR